jgi:hypothetical protein
MGFAAKVFTAAAAGVSLALAGAMLAHSLRVALGPFFGA